jgi:hypothetical protein
VSEEIELKKIIGGTEVVLNVFKELKPQGEWLLSLFELLHQDGKPIADGTSVRVGWSILRLYKRDGALKVFEPEFSGDPFKDCCNGASHTLKIIGIQHQFLEHIGIDSPVDWTFGDKIVLAKGAINNSNIYLERTTVTTPGDSGWFIGNARKNTEEVPEYEAVYAYQLLTLRPEVLAVLSLPPGYVVVFKSNKIEAVLNPMNVNIWKP